MCKHEEKHCPRCGASFECKVGDITQCQCYAVHVNDAERNYIGALFQDCLCASCIRSLKTSYNIAQRQIQLKVFFNGR
jgi:cysteine-rich CWC protein